MSKADVQGCVQEKYKGRLRAFVALLTFVIVGSGSLFAQQVYYVDPAGSDNNDGRSMQSAWRTVGKVNQMQYTPGDQILFKRGGRWAQELNVTSSGTSSARITYGAYGAGAKPQIDAGDELTGWNDASRWTSLGNNLWKFSSSRHPGRLWLSGVEYGISGSGSGGTTTPDQNYRWYDDGNGNLTVWATSNPAQAYTSIRVANGGRDAMSFSNKSYVTFQNLDFRGGMSCIEIDNGDYLLFDSCAIAWGTSRYGLFLAQGSDNGEIRYCAIDRYDLVSHGFQYGGDETGGNGIDNIAMQAASNWRIHHSVIADPGHCGINITGEAAQGWKSNSNKIYNNEFFMRGADYGRALGVQSSDYGYCAYNEIYNNYFHNHSVRIQFEGDHNRFYYNIVDTTRHCPYESDAERGGAIGLFDYMISQYNEVENNVFMNSDGPGITLVHSDGVVHHNRIINNIFVNNGKFGGTKPGLKNLEFWSWGTGSNSTNCISNNIFYNSSTTTPIIYRNGYTTTPISVADFNKATGAGDTLASNLGSNPVLNKDYTLTAGSPAIDAGRNVGLAQDYAGHAVSLPPCIGAYEGASSNTTTAVEDHTTEPKEFSLEQNYPNPFNPSTTIHFTLAKAGMTVVRVYNIVGQEVATLVAETMAAGRHALTWNATGMASGVYVYKIEAEGFSAARRMILLK